MSPEPGFQVFDFGPDDVGRHLDASAEELGQSRRDGAKARRRVGFLGPPEMGGEDEFRAPIKEKLNRRQGGPDAGIVGDHSAVV
jgi:hypothetical protein